MKVYMDLNANEIVVDDVAYSRFDEDVRGYELMSVVANLSWDELQPHLDHNFIERLYEKYREENFESRFEEYELIESE